MDFFVLDHHVVRVVQRRIVLQGLGWRETKICQDLPLSNEERKGRFHQIWESILFFPQHGNQYCYKTYHVTWE